MTPDIIKHICQSVIFSHSVCHQRERQQGQGMERNVTFNRKSMEWKIHSFMILLMKSCSDICQLLWRCEQLLVIYKDLYNTPHLKINECHCIILQNIKTLLLQTNDAGLICFLFWQLTAHSLTLITFFFFQ